MGGRPVTVVLNTNKSAKIKKWKVKEGMLVSSRQIIFIYDLASPEPNEKQLKFKSTQVGTVRKIIAKEGDVVPPGGVLLELEECKHPTVMKDMCAECGADLRKNEQVPTNASVPMVHSIPELKVSEEQAQKIGKADENRLISDRKLVLLVDLDQTLIHTTNDNIPPNLKDVYHFRLYGHMSPWYHTRIRPRTHEFLEEISQYYELHICTFGARNYAHTIAMFLDPEGKFFSHRILSRDECFSANSKTANLKALFPCGDNMVCIIDDREDVWNYAANLIHVKPYHFFKHTGDINAPPGLTKNENDEVDGFDFSNLDKPSKEEKPSKSENKVESKVNQKKQASSSQLKSKLDVLGESTTDKDTEDEAEKKQKEKEQEESRAKDIEKVTNDLQLSEDDSDDPVPAKEKPKESAVPAGEQPKESAVLAGEKSKESSVPAGEKPKESAVSAGEKSKESEVPEGEKAKESTILAGEKPKGSTAPAEEKPKESAVPTGEKRKESTVPAGEKPKESTVTAEEKPKESAVSAGEKPKESTVTTEKPKKSVEEKPKKSAAVVEEKLKKSTVVAEEKARKSLIGAEKKRSEEKAKAEKRKPAGLEGKKDRVNEKGKKTDSGVANSKRTAEGVSESGKETKCVAAESEALIEVDDSDDYLMYLEDILKSIHKSYYEEYDALKKSGKLTSIPDLKKVIPNVKKKVLRGCHLVFSGLVPSHVPLEQSRAYLVAVSLGATVASEITSSCTHLVAARPGTAKVNSSRRQKGIVIVTPLWLWHCAERWERLDERLYPLGRGGVANRVPPAHCGSPDHGQTESYSPALRNRTPSGRFIDTINPLLTFSSEDMKIMDQEVEDLFKEEDDDDETETEMDKVVPKIKAPTKLPEIEDPSTTSSEDSLSGASHPKGWREKKSRKRKADTTTCTETEYDDDFPSVKFRRGEPLPSDLDLGDDSQDTPASDEAMDDGEWNMMGAALEREFLSGE